MRHFPPPFEIILKFFCCLGHFLLTNLLIDKLSNGAEPGRVINVTAESSIKYGKVGNCSIHNFFFTISYFFFLFGKVENAVCIRSRFFGYSLLLLIVAEMHGIKLSWLELEPTFSCFCGIVTDRVSALVC